MPRYHSLFTRTLSAIVLTTSCIAIAAEPEKEELKFGFIKLTDMAPLAVAYEKATSKTKACMCLSKRKRTGKCCLTA